MSMISDIKREKTRLMRDGDLRRSRVLTTLVSETQRVSKDPTSDEVISTIVGMVKSLKELRGSLLEVGKPTDDVDYELEVLNNFLPSQLTEDELRAEVVRVTTELSLSGPKGIGWVIGELKRSHPNAFDGAMAARIAKEVLTDA